MTSTMSHGSWPTVHASLLDLADEFGRDTNTPTACITTSSVDDDWGDEGVTEVVVSYHEDLHLSRRGLNKDCTGEGQRTY